VRWLRRLANWMLRPYRTVRVEAPGQRATGSEDLSWNQLVGDGWVERWHPSGRYRRRDWLWVRRMGDELFVFPGSQDRPRSGRDPHYRLNGELVYRESGHPEGASSVPWYVIRSWRVYPGEGYPGGLGGRHRYQVERMSRKSRGVTIRPVQDRDHLGDDQR
jgi:hypothetical protein